MKKVANILTWASILLHVVSAQNFEVLKFSAVYRVQATKNNLLFIDDSCKLNISNSYSYFYSLGTTAFYEKNLKELEHRINTTKGGNLSLGAVQTCKTCYQNTYYKNYSQNKVYRIASLMQNSFAYPIDTMVAIHWVLQPDSAIINNIFCYKAIGLLEKTIYTAWYAPSIAIPDGPVFLKGLPGLILKSETNSGIKISLVSLAQTSISDKVINKLAYSFQITTYKDFKAAENSIKEEMNSGKEVQIGGGIGTIKRVN